MMSQRPFKRSCTDASPSPRLTLTDVPASVQDNCTSIPHLYTCPHTMCYPCVPQMLKASQGHSLVKSHAGDDTMKRLCHVP